MASTGMTLEEFFRAKYCLKKEDDLFQLIEAAVMVAVFEKKVEFHKRKERFAQILNTDDAVFLSSEDSDDDDAGGELQQASPALVAAAAHQSSGDCQPGSRAANSGNGLRKNKNSEDVINEGHGIQEKQRPREKGSNREKKGSGFDDRKFEASERKLEQRYRDLEKRKRKIQILEINDAPKLENSGKVAKKIRF